MARIVNYLPESFHLPDFCIQNAVKKGKKIPQTLVTSSLRKSVFYSYSTVAGFLMLFRRRALAKSIRIRKFKKIDARPKAEHRKKYQKSIAHALPSRRNQGKTGRCVENPDYYKTVI